MADELIPFDAAAAEGSRLPTAVRTEIAALPAVSSKLTEAQIATAATTPGAPIQQALANTYAPVSLGVTRSIRTGPLTIFLGDSITQNLNTLTDPTQLLLGESFATLVSIKSNQRILYGLNAGVTNDTVQMAAARLQNDVIVHQPDRCVILLGTNNDNQASPTPAETMAAYENDILKPLLAAGIEPIICTIPPRTGVRTSEPTTYRRQASWNAYLRSVANRYRIRLVDLYTVLADPTTGDYKATYSGDGVHPSKIGYKAMTEAFVAATLPMYPAEGVALERDRYSPISLAPNPLFLEGMTGAGNLLPTGWTGSNTGVTITLEDPTPGDGLEAGKWFKIVKTDAATSKNINWIKALAGLGTAGNPLAAGDRISWGFRYKLSGGTTASTYLTVALRYTNSSGVDVKSMAPVNQFQLDSEGVVYFEAPVPANCANLRFDLSFSTTSLQTLMLGQMTVRNLSGLGLSALTRP